MWNIYVKLEQYNEYIVSSADYASIYFQLFVS